MKNLSLYIIEKFKLNKEHKYRKAPEVGDKVLVLIEDENRKTCDARLVKIVHVGEYEDFSEEQTERYRIKVSYGEHILNEEYPRIFITTKNIEDYDAKELITSGRGKFKPGKLFILFYKDNAIQLLEDFLKRYKQNKDKKLYNGYTAHWDNDFLIDIVEDIIKDLKKEGNS